MDMYRDRSVLGIDTTDDTWGSFSRAVGLRRRGIGDTAPAVYANFRGTGLRPGLGSDRRLALGIPSALRWCTRSEFQDRSCATAMTPQAQTGSPTSVRGRRYPGLMALAGVLILALAAARADVYKHIGPGGEVIYSDTLPMGTRAQPIDGQISSYAAPQRSFPGASEPAARSNPRVVIYTTTWCGVCKRAKAYMERKGIRYTEYDVEKSAKGKREFQAMNARAVPLLVVGEQRMYGFDVDRLEAMLAAR